jgi:indole-3-glycerol phosphate synthase
VEVRSEAELETALLTEAPMIGVNARDLETLEIDPTVVERLLPQIPPGRVAIAESGVRRREDVERAALSGADAVLVGSSLSQAADPVSLARELAGVARVPRGA